MYQCYVNKKARYRTRKNSNLGKKELIKYFFIMAKTGEGKKKVYVKPHTKKTGNKTVKVPAHYRSTPN